MRGGTTGPDGAGATVSGEPRTTDAEQAALNEFLRLYLEDQAAGRTRAPAEYQALFPGHEARLALEYELLCAASAPGSEGVAPVLGQSFGPYQFVRPLGRGGQGRVWLARDTRLGRLVALKLLAELAVLEPSSLERFRREARIASRLSDPGICTVYETGIQGGIPFLAMRYVEGEALSRVIERARTEGVPPLPLVQEPGHEQRDTDGLRRIARLIERLARSLHEAHEAGIVHRDVKPGNVILSRDGLPVLVDFGLASVQDPELATLTRTGDALGTPAYMSPEQLAEGGRHLDRRTDVYSLGVVLYECLTLRRPFQADSHEALLRAILSNAPPDPRRHLPDLPEDLGTIAAVALERERARRYSTAAALAEDLRRFQAGEPILARPPSRIYRLRKLVGRHRALATSLLALGLVMITAVALVTRGLLRERLRAAEVLRLSALQRLDDLTAEADLLWPAHPSNVPRYEDWSRRARELVAELPRHESVLAELRARAVPGEGGEPDFESREDKWWYGQLEKLVERLRALLDPKTGLLSGTSPEHGWGVEKRLELARTLAARSLSGREARQRWEAAIASIASAADSPAYRGLVLAPQIGLLPLGKDPESGLWEFAHLPSGEPCERGPDGRLRLTPESGIVLVLLPGGTFTMGAQARDEAAANYDPFARPEDGPPREVTLSPFFLGKFEMTQGQWQRSTGVNPSEYTPSNGLAASLLDPVEQTTWFAGRAAMSWLGLELPSEAQWEFGARAGTGSVWWTGDDKQSLLGTANIADQTAHRERAPWATFEDWLDDGFTLHAPVDQRWPNPFGLHDVHGNIAEWCLDGFDAEFPRPTGKDPVVDPDSAPNRAVRGGCFHDDAVAVRMAYRVGLTPGFIVHTLGLRAARSVQE